MSPPPNHAVSRAIHVGQVLGLILGHAVEREQCGQIAMRDLGAPLLDVADGRDGAADLLGGRLAGDLGVDAHALERRADLDAVGCAGLQVSSWVELAQGAEIDYNVYSEAELCFDGRRGTFQIHASEDGLAELVSKGSAALEALRQGATDE